MVALVVVIGGLLQSTKKVLDHYVARVQSGESVSSSVGGDEAPVLTEALRSSHGLTVHNAQSQAGTSCVWARVDTSSGMRDIRFVLRGDGEGAAVVAASLARECECPDPDIQKPCLLR